MKALRNWTFIFILLAISTTLVFLFGQRPLDYEVATVDALEPCTELGGGEPPLTVFLSLSSQYDRFGISERNSELESQCFGASIEQCREAANLYFVDARNFAMTEKELNSSQASFIGSLNAELSSALNALITGNAKTALMHLTSAAELDFDFSKDRRAKTSFAARPLAAAFSITSGTQCHVWEQTCIQLAVAFGKFLYRHNLNEAARAVFIFAAQSQTKDHYTQPAVLDLFFKEESRFADTSYETAKIAFRSAHLYEDREESIPAGVRFFFAAYHLPGDDDALPRQDRACLMNMRRYSLLKADQHFIRAGFGADWRETFTILSLGSMTRWLAPRM